MAKVYVSGQTFYHPSSNGNSDLLLLDVLTKDDSSKRLDVVNVLFPNSFSQNPPVIPPGVYNFSVDVRPRSGGKGGSNYWYLSHQSSPPASGK